MGKIDALWHTIKWSVELSEFGLDFLWWRIIEAHALTNFVAECSFSKQPEPLVVEVPLVDQNNVPFEPPTKNLN